MTLSRWRRFAAPVVVLLTGACGVVETLARAHEPYDRFARGFIADFHQGGLPAIRQQVKPATLRGAVEAETGFAVMHAALPSSIDSIRPRGEGEVEEGWRSGVARLHYRVYGSDRSADVDLWIEKSGKQFYAETIQIGPAIGDR